MSCAYATHRSRGRRHAAARHAGVGECRHARAARRPAGEAVERRRAQRRIGRQRLRAGRLFRRLAIRGFPVDLASAIRIDGNHGVRRAERAAREQGARRDPEGLRGHRQRRRRAGRRDQLRDEALGERRERDGRRRQPRLDVGGRRSRPPLRPRQSVRLPDQCREGEHALDHRRHERTAHVRLDRRRLGTSARVRACSSTPNSSSGSAFRPRLSAAWRHRRAVGQDDVEGARHAAVGETGDDRRAEPECALRLPVQRRLEGLHRRRPQPHDDRRQQRVRVRLLVRGELHGRRDVAVLLRRERRLRRLRLPQPRRISSQRRPACGHDRQVRDGRCGTS